jgi:hypothetical protein
LKFFRIILPGFFQIILTEMKRAIRLADPRPLNRGLKIPPRWKNDSESQSRYQANFQTGQKISMAKTGQMSSLQRINPLGARVCALIF